MKTPCFIINISSNIFHSLFNIFYFLIYFYFSNIFYQIYNKYYIIVDIHNIFLKYIYFSFKKIIIIHTATYTSKILPVNYLKTHSNSYLYSKLTT